MRLEIKGRLPTCVKLLPHVQHFSRCCLQRLSIYLAFKINVSRGTLLLSVPSPPFSFLFVSQSLPSQTVLLLLSGPTHMTSYFPQKPVLLKEDPEARYGDP